MNNTINLTGLFLKVYLPALIVITLATAVYGDESISDSEFKVITDCTGRVVKTPVQVNRIACLYAFTGHAVTMLGRGSDIVAVSRGLKRDSLLLDICPSINNAIVPKSQGALNIEEVLRAAPDVLFIPGDMSGNRGEIEKLNRLGIPTIIIDYSNMESQQKAISIIGEVIGRPERAKQYNEYYQGCVERVNILLKRIPQNQKPRLYHSVLEATRTTLKHGLTADWLRITGVINVALTSDMNIMEGKNFVSLEQIILWNPDVILANEPEARKLILGDRKWALINAVRNKRVYQMPIAISRWGHPGSIETPLVILWTVKKLYPDLFEDLDMKKETESYYDTFFDYKLTDSKIDAILEGRLLRKSKYDSRK
jgi:iron complex transport system substrate-binding protein